MIRILTTINEVYNVYKSTSEHNMASSENERCADRGYLSRRSAYGYSTSRRLEAVGVRVYDGTHGQHASGERLKLD